VPYGSRVEETAAVLDVLPGSPEAEPAPSERTGPALSPSRAADFMTCPLLYRFRVIDRLPEPPTEATARGTLVHAALERLFDLPAAERTPEAARALVVPEWDRLAAEEPELAALFPDEAERATWLRSAIAILEAYFAALDGKREVALAAARRVDAAKDDDVEDLYLVVIGLEVGGDHAGAEAVRQIMRRSPGGGVGRAVMLRWLELDQSPRRAGGFTPLHATTR